jgi:PAS domain S-box-containing protein
VAALRIEETIMRAGDPAVNVRTGYALFDSDDMLVDANAEIFGGIAQPRGEQPPMDVLAAVARVLRQFASFDGLVVEQTDDFVRRAALRWRQPNVPPIEAQTVDGAWKLLTSHPRLGTGIALISTDITEMKLAQIAHLNSAEIFRCITDSHPLPVWVVDEESKQILYESLDGSHLLGRKWQPQQQQRLTDHFVNPDEFDQACRHVHGNDILRDCEIEMQREDGSNVWCSTNWRRSVFRSRPSLVIGVLDITERKKAEAAEREATSLMQRVLDACPSPTRMSTIEGETLYANPASRELYGDRPHIADYYVNPADREILVSTLLDKGSIDDFRVRQYCSDDTIFWGSLSARLIDFQGKKVIVSNATNINAMIMAQQQTRQANNRLTDAIESLAEGFALYDKDDCLVLANSQYRKMHAICADVLVPGVNWFDFLRVTAERSQFRVPGDKIDEWLAERARDRREYRQQEFQHADGGWFFVSNSPTREGGFVVTRLDITERKRAELAAKEADDLVRRVLEASPVSIQMTRAHDGKQLYSSPATTRLLGDVVGALDHFASQAHRDEYIERLLRDGAVDEFETQLKRSDGQTFWCSISSRLIDFHGEQVIVSHTHDLSDRIELQKQVEHQREKLHQNEKLSALGGLLAGVAHELNNPLSVVLGMSLTLKETSVDAKTVERADKISKAAERCARIVKTFLAMARQQPTRATNVSIDEVVSAALEVVNYSIRSSDIQLMFDLEPDLPAIWGDPDQLSQVLINLLVNAEHALHHWEGSRKILVATGRHPECGNITISVTDTGPGIAEEILPRIFEPFFTTKEVGAGTGIGLSFCHRIIQAHQGTIEVETMPGGGSTFVVSLPASDRFVETSGPSDDEPKNSAGLSCLVVDDEREVADLIAEVLMRDGFTVVVARSGEEALTQLRKRTFAVILSDLKMPSMDGRRLYNYIADYHPAEVDRLAFLTGDTISPDAQVFLRATKRPYLEKPVKPIELRRFVSGLVVRQV